MLMINYGNKITYRTETKSVMVRNVRIGGGAPIPVQSMTNVDSRNEEALIEQLAILKDAGCDIVRIAIPDRESVTVFKSVRKKTDIPLVADIHFDYRLAIEAILAGADKIRINPGNIGSDDCVKKVVCCAKEHGAAIRVGVNSGSLENDILIKNKGVTAEGLAESAIRNIRKLEDMDFDDVVLSIKSSDVQMNYKAHMIAARLTDHPLHIGITESGIPSSGKVKSAAGIGALLLAGIGDTIRVSLTADPVEEVLFARRLLEVLAFRKPKFELISCPTCGRTKVNIKALADEADRRLSKTDWLPQGLKIAVMGCVVNGPGEAGETDYCICGGNGKGIVYAHGQKVISVAEDRLIDAMMDVIKSDCKQGGEGGE